jgi:hypothetical protein
MVPVTKAMVRAARPALCAFLLLVGLTGPVLAAPPATEREVEHLLRVVETSSCGFLRNDSRYGGRLAAAFFRGKFHSARDRINTTEEFIGEMLPKKGDRYVVDCAADEPESGESWLKSALAAYRRTEMARR